MSAAPASSPSVAGASSGHGSDTLAAALAWVPSTAIGRLSNRTIGWIPGPRLQRTHQVSSGIVLLASNLIGAAIVVVLNVWVIPGKQLPDRHVGWSLLVIAAYVLVAFPLGGAVIYHHSNVVWRWLADGRQPTDQEETQVLRSPIDAVKVLLALWLIGVAWATIVGSVDSLRLGIHVFITTLIGGVTTCAFGYVLAERTLRPAARVMLEHSTAVAPALPGTAARQLFTWGLGTGSAVFGIWIVGVLSLTGANPASSTALGIAMVVLASITLTAGLLAEIVTARAVADPIRRMRTSVARLTAGDLSARVPIDDATEVGLLQAGFNRMAVGIQEREELRDLFGRHVGGEVAATALARGVELGGESVEVGAMFVDVVGSTTLATERPATEVVELINRFFDVVIEVTERHGGLVNKFAGDGALIVFGAPVADPDYATHALRAARELTAELDRLAPATPATIGVSGGEVIAGNMGSSKRFEYTVMGDPVNEAARLGAQAGSLPGRVAVSGGMYARAAEDERVHWEIVDSVVLRGRSAHTDVAGLREGPITPGDRTASIGT